MIFSVVRVGPRQSRASGAYLIRITCPALLLLIAVMICGMTQVLKTAHTRYVHPTYKFRSTLGNYDHDDQHQVNPSGISRRQDFENDDDDGDDQNAAASYQNQDDGNGGDGGAATDGYDDTEPGEHQTLNPESQ